MDDETQIKNLQHTFLTKSAPKSILLSDTFLCLILVYNFASNL